DAVGRVEAAGGDARACRGRDAGQRSRAHDDFLDSKPATPRGRNRVTRMKISPRKYSQYSGNACVKKLFAPFTRPAPKAAPTSVPRPPTATQMAISIELAGDISLGLMMPTCGT